MPPLIQLNDIRKRYRLGPIDIEVLKGINLSIDDGELISIVGASGCGKTTLMNIVGLMDQATSGTYIIDNREVGKVRDRELSALRNRKIGFVFQGYHLLPRLNVIDNVGIPLIYRGVKAKEIRQRCREILQKVGMLDREHQKLNQLSGGQQQRVAIARAVVGRPTLILADEPTGALDADTGADIMRLFQQLNRDEGMTFLIISHDPKIAATCKRQIRMDDGVLYEDADPATLLAS